MEKSNKSIQLRTVFMGTSSLAQTVLKALIDEKYNIVGVFTKPDKKAGREQTLAEIPVKKLAEENSIPVFQPAKFDDDAIEELKKLKPDMIIVAAYGRILPKKVLDMPGFGCINVHVSLLPKYRGPSPIQNVLFNGEKETGTTIMLMDEGIDTGNILSQEKMAIADADTADVLSEKLADLSAKLLIQTLPLWVDRKIESQSQDHANATLCQLIEREDGHIFWEEEAENIYNKYRALHPWPGVFTFWRNGATLGRLKLLTLSLQRMNPQTKVPVGQVFQLGDKVGVQTLEGVIILEQVQLEGKKPLSIVEFINGYPSFVGSVLQ
jgi:methionyl-tRNA formyltransferase